MNTLNERIAELRSKVLAKTATPEELREGLRILRAERMGAAERRTERKAAETKIKATVDVSALLAKLGVKS